MREAQLPIAGIKIAMGVLRRQHLKTEFKSRFRRAHQSERKTGRLSFLLKTFSKLKKLLKLRKPHSDVRVWVTGN
jgi:hypothetical protein